MVRLLDRGCVPAMERLGAGLHCTKYCGRATQWVGPSQPVYRDIAFKK